MTKKISEQYDKFANKFSVKARKQNVVNIDEMRKQVNFSVKNKKILDMGCGDGEELLFYKSKGAIIYGLDASKELINLAKQRLPNIDLEVCLFESTPYKNIFFDVVVSKYAFQHSYEIEPIYKEVVRIIKKKGLFIFLVTHPLRQFIEKKKKNKDYFKKEVVNSIILDATLTVKEPSHTLSEYFSDFFLENFEIISIVEKHDPAAEKIGNDIYPGFMIIKARKK